MASFAIPDPLNYSKNCFPGETTMYLSVYAYLDWIRNITQGDICETDLPDDEQPTTGPDSNNNTTQSDLVKTDLLDDEKPTTGPDLSSNTTHGGLVNYLPNYKQLTVALILLIGAGFIVLVVFLFSRTFNRPGKVRGRSKAAFNKTF